MINLRNKRAISPRTETDLAPPSQREAELVKAERLVNAAPDGPLPRRALIPDPEVPAVPKRRQFPAAYKARIVEEAGECT